MLQPPRSRPENARIQASSGNQFLVKRALWGTHPKQGNPSRIQAQTCQNHSPVKLPNVAFCRPKETERWCNVTTNKRWCNHQDQCPKTRGFKPQAEANSSSKGSVGHASETGEPQQDSSPNLPKPCAVKLPNVAFWRPKETERWWCNHKQKMMQKMMQPPRSRPEEREDWSLKRKPIPRQRALWGMHPKQGNPSRIQAQTCQNHPP